MIAIPPGVRVLVAMRPVDFRKGANGLAAEVLGGDPFSIAALVFRAKRADRIKLDTRIYPCGLSGWLDLNLDTALLAV
ncbi:IS66 family insertion sequence element accessory protein TnpB [Acidiphilium cryptum]|uniref:Transposase n=1 Tax=Acidiphilium cryptum (strain JF-5) TaxID=349163 RepID=A5FWL6_ACICJ|nr:IS66 family insertion sequence element accessory protein TnpB [Acidiphilium cryptum]ABQ29998.1 hypothetical protein Acry_0778 [Acidiphilium cryptum JF-5]